jgi:hypothetical protein
MPSSRRRLARAATLATAASAAPVLEGYDMVSFKPGAGVTGVMGKASIAYNLTSQDNGVDRFVSEFWFSSEANKAAFVADPWTYAPRWGGF